MAIRRLSEEQLRRGLDEVIHLQGRIRSIIDTIKAIEAKQVDTKPLHD
jgi:hypothetical protein